MAINYVSSALIADAAPTAGSASTSGAQVGRRA
mgnify:CR=1 FL=1